MYNNSPQKEKEKTSLFEILLALLLLLFKKRYDRKSIIK